MNNADNVIPETPSPEECADKIYEISGAKFDPDIAADLWQKILQHKWLMSEKLTRDVGLKTACIDFLENMDQALREYIDYKGKDVLTEMGAQKIELEYGIRYPILSLQNNWYNEESFFRLKKRPFPESMG